jgi:hypothetical protein
VLSAAITSPLVCFVQLFIRYVAVCCLRVCVCVPDVLVCGMSGCETRPPEDGQTVVTETCRVLIMCFKKHFLNSFSVLNVNIGCVLKRSA